MYHSDQSFNDTLTNIVSYEQLDPERFSFT